MELDDRKWGLLSGGYKIPYDASKPIRKLKGKLTQVERQDVFDELWKNLHHEGDVGLASYVAVPHLVDTCIETKSLDWNYIGLCVLIENCRLDPRNPELPTEEINLYLESLTRFEKYLSGNLKNLGDQDAFRFTLALLATLNGQPKLGRAIEILDGDEIDELLSRYQ